MPTQYKLQPSDTIATLQRRAGVSLTLQQLADFNGIPDPALLVKARMLNIPTTEDLPQSIPTDGADFPPPNGLTEIRNVFGDIYDYIDAQTGELNPEWESGMLGRVPLPDTLLLGWDLSKSIQSFRAHALLLDRFKSVFEQIYSAGLWSAIQTYDGAYNYRAKRGGSSLSVHAWGIAIDLNASTNERGTEGDMDPQLIEIFVAAGFYWGGNWRDENRDPMHFQYCTGY